MTQRLGAHRPWCTELKHVHAVEITEECDTRVETLADLYDVKREGLFGFPNK